MAWQVVQRRRGPRRAGGAELAAEVLRSLFSGGGGRAAGAGGGGDAKKHPPHRAAWRCTCGAPNWEERGSCRRCGAARAGAPARCPPPAPAAERAAERAASGRADWPLLPGTEPRPQAQVPREDSRERVPSPAPGHRGRPPAPEDAAAAAAAQADALEASADQLDSVRLGPAAAQLRRQAADLRKRAAAPAPGRRLDLLEAFVKRAATRASKAAAAVEAAEVSLAEARSQEETLQRELEEGEAKLAQLRAELQTERMDDAPASSPAAAGWAHPARALLQALNTSQLVCPVSGLPPESIAAPVAALHAALGDVEYRVRAARLDEAIEESRARKQPEAEEQEEDGDERFSDDSDLRQRADCHEWKGWEAPEAICKLRSDAGADAGSEAGRPVTWQCGWAGIRVGEVKHPGPPGAGSQLACPNCHGLLRAARPDSTAETCAVHGGPGRGGWLYRCEPCGAAVCRDCAVDAAAPAAASVGLGSAAGADGTQALAAAAPATAPASDAAAAAAAAPAQVLQKLSKRFRELFQRPALFRRQGRRGCATDGADLRHRRLWRWGNTEAGYMRQGEVVEVSKTPTPVEEFQGASSAACGSSHSAVVVDGQLYTCGSNKYSQLGREASDESDSSTFAAVSVPGRVKQVALGAYHSAAVTESGDLWTWGWGGSFWYGAGALGHGSSETMSEPTRVAAFGEQTGERVLQVACGAQHTVVLLESGRLFSTGKGDFGRLGHGSTRDEIEFEEESTTSSRSATRTSDRASRRGS
ncbi:unnamed protein product [Prorocentrum cordatum]|uniref:RING-type E3 ubiquitin transferase n=1 Tax=Prorocentrum cordatum TaxID=2364126 RepID=A0ABN9XLJ7_9DINO|nr:unnamed protein product [Polarella glacialis]